MADFKKQTLAKMATFFERRAVKTKCGGCKRRALKLAQIAKQAAAAKQSNG